VEFGDEEGQISIDEITRKSEISEANQNFSKIARMVD
jgi:hypothetical protein